jgi:hypothetical protein
MALNWSAKLTVCEWFETDRHQSREFCRKLRRGIDSTIGYGFECGDECLSGNEQKLIDFLFFCFFALLLSITLSHAIRMMRNESSM